MLTYNRKCLKITEDGKKKCSQKGCLEMFDYITRFNAFLDRSMGTLDQSEVVVYVRLFQLNNNYRRVEWFGVLNVNLAELAGMSEKTLIKTRNSLKQKGYIDFIQGKKGCKTKYKLLPIENVLENLQHNYSSSTVNLQHNYSSSTVQGTDLIKDKDKEKDRVKRTRKTFVPPSLDEVKSYITEKNLSVSAERFHSYYEAGNWHDSKGNPVKNWKQKCLTWERQNCGQVQQRQNVNEFGDEKGDNPGTWWDRSCAMEYKIVDKADGSKEKVYL